MIRRALFAALGLSLISIPAGAFVLAGRSVLRHFAEAQSTIHGAGSPLIGTAHLRAQLENWPARLELTKGGCRAQVKTPQGDALVAISAGRMTTQGASLPALEAFVALACPILSMRDIPANDAETTITQLIASLGVDTSVSALSRINDQVGYIVGAKPRDAKRPQIWFDKDNERPLRIIASHANQLWDIRLLDSASIATNRLAPRIVSVWTGADRQLEIEWMAQNPKLSGHETPTQEMGEDDE